jgi:hypothetical protein
MKIVFLIPKYFLVVVLIVISTAMLCCSYTQKFLSKLGDAAVKEIESIEKELKC